MAKRYGELEDNEKEVVDSLVTLHESDYNGPSKFTKHATPESLKDKLGVCYDCAYLQYCKTKMDNIFARCKTFNIRLNPDDVVDKCSNYKCRREMSLWDMKELAWMIENKNKVGFKM